MLDRKTKDKDASIEQLTDRLEESKKWQWVMYLLSVSLFIFGLIFYYITGLVGVSMFIGFVGIIAYTGFYTIIILRSNTNLLLYFKEREDKNNVKGEKHEQKSK